jgi:hypothetical protein
MEIQDLRISSGEWDCSIRRECPWDASSTSYDRPVGLVKAADHPISYPETAGRLNGTALPPQKAIHLVMSGLLRDRQALWFLRGLPS